MNILFVCTANISRSFFAEMLFKHEAKLNKLDHIGISSGGTHAFPGNPPDQKMVDYLLEIGVPVEPHTAIEVTKGRVEWADLILVMEKQHKETLEDEWPGAEEKIELLGKYLSDGQIIDDIIDPYGRSQYHYRLTWSQITMAIENLVKKLLQDKNAQNKNHSC